MVAKWDALAVVLADAHLVILAALQDAPTAALLAVKIVVHHLVQNGVHRGVPRVVPVGKNSNQEGTLPINEIAAQRNVQPTWGTHRVFRHFLGLEFFPFRRRLHDPTPSGYRSGQPLGASCKNLAFVFFARMENI